MTSANQIMREATQLFAATQDPQVEGLALVAQACIKIVERLDHLTEILAFHYGIETEEEPND